MEAREPGSLGLPAVVIRHISSWSNLPTMVASAAANHELLASLNANKANILRHHLEQTFPRVKAVLQALPTDRPHLSYDQLVELFKSSREVEEADERRDPAWPAPSTQAKDYGAWKSNTMTPSCVNVLWQA